MKAGPFGPPLEVLAGRDVPCAEGRGCCTERPGSLGCDLPRLHGVLCMYTCNDARVGESCAAESSAIMGVVNLPTSR